MIPQQALVIADFVSKQLERATNGDDAAMVLHSFAYAIGCEIARFTPEHQSFILMQLSKAMGEALIDFSAKAGLPSNITMVVQEGRF